MKAVLVSVFASAAVVLSLVGVGQLLPRPVTESIGASSATAIQWWFDVDRGTLCWIGKRASYSADDIIVDLDGNHDTGFTSWFMWRGDVRNYTAPRTWDGHGSTGLPNETAGTGTESLLSDLVVYPPWPHYRFGAIPNGPWSEWVHAFVTKRTPPTDWVLGWSSDDGNRSLPITKPFWVSFDFGGNWTGYDPANYVGPTGVCKEDGGTSTVPWWFDPARGTVCWIGKRPSWEYDTLIIDLDGIHDTGVTSSYEYGVDTGNFTSPMTWFGSGSSSIGDETNTTISLLSDVVVRPPMPHIQFPIFGRLSEWFHPFVTKRTPPTDWVLGVSDDDGHRALPILHPFWISLDVGKTWAEYDPSAFVGPTGVCKEDLPPAQTLNATVDFDPDTLNPRSQGKWVTVYIELPQGYDPRDINATTIRLNDTLAPVLDPKYGFVTDPGGYITDHDHDGITERMVKFDRAAVIALLKPGTYPVRVAGELMGGRTFEGLSEPIRVLPPW